MAVPSVAYAAYRRTARPSVSIPVDQWQQNLSLDTMEKKPVAINIGGKRFETYEQTLNLFPNTLLGCPDKRKRHYDQEKEEYFFDRHRSSFTAILYYYQSGGVLERPPHVPAHIFMEELEYFQLTEAIQQQNKEMREEADKKTDGSADGDQTVRISERTDPDEPTNEMQRKIWKLFEQPNSSKAAKTLAVVSLVIIVLSIIVFCVETLPDFDDSSSNEANINGTTGQQNKGKNAKIFFTLNAICSGWFTVEYVIRLAVSTNKIKFLKSFLNILDLLSILPFYVSLIFHSNSSSIGVLRVMRVIRVCRIFKLTRHSKGLYILGMTLKSSMNELFMLMLFLLIGVILFASAVYYAEVDENQKQFASIPHSFWWAVVTMTTVGYGDVSPITLVGKLVGAMCALSGVLAIALPVPVIVSNFEYYYKEVLEKEQIAAAADPDHCNNISYKNLNQLVKQSSPLVERKIILSRNASPIGTPVGTPRFARHLGPTLDPFSPRLLKKKNGALNFPKEQIKEVESCSTGSSRPTSPDLENSTKKPGHEETFI